jgi:ribonuclease Z
MPRLVVLGSGTTYPSPVRWGSSFLLGIANRWVMFDCGPAATYKLYKAGFKATQVVHLFFTHHHSDHDADYPCFLLARWDMSTGKESQLQAWGPPPTQQLTERLVGEGTGAFWHDIVARTNHQLSLWAHQSRGGTLPRRGPEIGAHDIGPGIVFAENSWKVTAARVEHVQPYLDSLAYRIDSDEGSIVFSGDTRPCETLTDLAKGADLLVMECIRLNRDMENKVPGNYESSTYAAGQTAKDAGVKKLLLVHQTLGLDNPEAHTQAIAEVKSIYAGPTIWADEGTDLVWP